MNEIEIKNKSIEFVSINLYKGTLSSRTGVYNVLIKVVDCDADFNTHLTIRLKKTFAQYWNSATTNRPVVITHDRRAGIRKNWFSACSTDSTPTIRAMHEWHSGWVRLEGWKGGKAGKSSVSRWRHARAPPPPHPIDRGFPAVRIDPCSSHKSRNTLCSRWGAPHM